MSLFEGQLVRLTRLERDNSPTYLRWLRDYEVRRWAEPGVITPMTEETLEEWYTEVAKSKEGYFFSIRTLDDDRLIGNCGLYQVKPKNRSAEFGILIGEKEYWGKGYGSDATRIMLRFAFDELNLNRVQLQVFDLNKRAIRAFEKAGFVLEGTARQSIFREGKYHDLHLMGILRDEWQAKQ